MTKRSLYFLSILLIGVSAQAQTPFYQGKTITIVVGTKAGDVYDLYPRLLSEFWPKHFPGSPNIIVQNVPGAGSLIAANQVYNVALNTRTTLNELFGMIHQRLLPDYPYLKNVKPIYEDFRQGDVRHSEADISKVSKLLGFQPTHRVEEGLDAALEWYKRVPVR